MNNCGFVKLIINYLSDGSDPRYAQFLKKLGFSVFKMS